MLQINRSAQLRECFSMLADRSARILNLRDYGIVVIDSDSPERAVAEIRHPMAVFKRGRRTLTRRPAQIHCPHHAH